MCTREFRIFAGTFLLALRTVVACLTDCADSLGWAGLGWTGLDWLHAVAYRSYRSIVGSKAFNGFTIQP